MPHRLTPRASAVLLALIATAALAQSDAKLHTLLSAGEIQTITQKYVGPGSCSAVACHGSIVPRTSTRVLQNEYSTWVTEDKHARAYTALTTSLSKQIAATLRLGPADKSQRCLTCHALSVPPALHARDFDIAEGVTCESCHGPAAAWLGPHIQANARHEHMVHLGLVDNKNLITRTERCLSCHLGDSTHNVDHELIAAGHPDLTFELDSFTAVTPPHWIEKNPDPLFGMHAWAIGQTVQLRESLLRVARRAHSGPWPEFSEMDCITCHHSLTGPESWRQREGYTGHRAGDPPYNLARLALFRHYANEIDAPLNRELEAELAHVAALVTSLSPDRSTVELAATHAATLADRLLAEVRTAQFDRARTQRLLRAIAQDADAISRQGERTAEQATMTVDSLYIASAKSGAPSPETRAAIDALFQQIKNPSAYNAPQFAAQLRKVGATIR